MLEVVLHIVLETLSEAPSSFHRERTLARKAVLFSVFRNLLFSLLHMTFSCVIGCYKNAEHKFTELKLEKSSVDFQEATFIEFQRTIRISGNTF